MKKKKKGRPKGSKKPFRRWLDGQSRKKLSYPGAVHESPRDKSTREVGWTIYDFLQEVEHRSGMALQAMTVYRWARGSKPRRTIRTVIEKNFQTVKF